MGNGITQYYRGSETFKLFPTAALVFTPVLRSTGERLDLLVDFFAFPSSNAPGFHGNVQDLKSGKWYAVYGKACDLPGCNCDAWVEELD